MRNAVLMSAVLLSVSVGAAPKLAEVVSVSQDAATHVVTVRYTLQGDERAIVTLDVLTNGVSVGSTALAHVAGDVNVIVPPGERKLIWTPDSCFPGRTFAAGELSAVVSAWSLDDPPPYFAVSLVAQKSWTFYASEDAVPLGVTNDLYKTDVLLMRRIPAKDIVWRMGGSSKETDRSPYHLVKLDHDYYIGVYEFTQQQWVNVFGSNPSQDKTNVNWRTRPVEYFTAYNAAKVLRGDKHDSNCAANTHENFGTSETATLASLRTLTGIAFDLPTAAEWEFAARAGKGSKWPGGDDEAGLDEYAWYKANSVNELGVAGSHPVGLKKKNAWGLYDVCGNVFEWTVDWYCNGYGLDAETLKDATAVQVNPNGGTHTNGRCIRGGSYSSSANDSSLDYRGSSNNGSATVGVRIWCPCDFSSSL